MPNVITEKELVKETQKWDEIWDDMTSELNHYPEPEQVQERYLAQAGIRLIF